MDKNPEIPCQIIREIAIVHCARGAQRCAKCKEIAGRKYCLLDICPENRGMVTRQVTEITWAGNKHFLEFEVLRTFTNRSEAESFADENGIAILP